MSPVLLEVGRYATFILVAASYTSRRGTLFRRLSGKWKIAIVVALASTLLASLCESSLAGWDETGPGHPHIYPLTPISEMPPGSSLKDGDLQGVKKFLALGTVFAHQRLVPNILKDRDTEVCAYILPRSGPDPIQLCDSLGAWMEKPTIQMTWLAWLNTIAISAWYFMAGCFAIKICLWLCGRVRALLSLNKSDEELLQRTPFSASRRQFIRLPATPMGDAVKDNTETIEEETKDAERERRSRYWGQLGRKLRGSWYCCGCRSWHESKETAEASRIELFRGPIASKLKFLQKFGYYLCRDCEGSLT